MEITDPELLSIKNVNIKKMNGLEISSFSDIIAVEEPLEIRINYGSGATKTQKTISVTMRTPGKDSDLAIGFLYTEGIISSFQDIERVYHAANKNILYVDFTENFIPNLMQADRNFYTTSSCGVCGKSSIESIKTVTLLHHFNDSGLVISAPELYQLPEKLRAAQTSFEATGGIHASGLFNAQGDLIQLSEDVGRHNALDKLIGSCLADSLMPLNQHILLLSGRASFELIQKAAMAGIKLVAAIGAPSSLAIELATEFDITLLGFLKQDRFNIYNCSKSITLVSKKEVAIN